jgi:hypothetical protein
MVSTERMPPLGDKAASIDRLLSTRTSPGSHTSAVSSSEY